MAMCRIVTQPVSVGGIMCITNHFRRTRATVLARCGNRPAALPIILGHFGR